MEAVQMTELPFVKELLDRGADVKAGDSQNNTALHKARFPEYAELLLASGADVNARNKEGRTPLMAGRGVKVAEVLIKAGAGGEHAGQ